MKNKIVILLLTGALSLSLGACGTSDQNSNESADKDKQIEALESENEELKQQIKELTKQIESSTEKQAESKEDSKEFKISDLSFDLSIVPSDNWVDISGTYTNHSEYTITDIIITYTDTMTNNTEYWGSSDTVLPGETSPISEGDTIDNMDATMESMSPTKYSIDAKDPSGKDVKIRYDVKLDEYDIH